MTRRAREGEAFLRRVAEHYDGTLEVADALSWLHDPDAPAPSGRLPPWAGLAAARERVYAPGAGAAAAEEYRRMLAARDRELDAVRRAMEAAGGPPDSAAPRRPVRRRWLPALAVSLAAALAFAAGTAAGGTLAARPRPVASPEPAQTPTPLRLTRPGGALEVFAQPQTIEDVPFLGPGTDLVPASFRLLAPLPGPAVRLYGALTRDDQVCLVALAADARLVASCASAQDFRSAPRTLDFSVTRDPERLDGADVRTEIAASWSYDGSLTAGAVG